MNSTRDSLSSPLLFLRVVRRLLDEDSVSRVFLPAVADFQSELREASGEGLTHALLRCRWYGALATLVVFTLLSMPTRANRERRAQGMIEYGWAPAVLLYVSLFVGAWSCVQEFMIAAIVAGAALACVLRLRNDRHGAVTITSREAWRDLRKASAASEALITSSAP